MPASDDGHSGDATYEVDKLRFVALPLRYAAMSSLRLLTISLVLFPSIASAHVALTDPVPRSGDNGLTMEPCGGVAAGTPTALMAGDTVTVTWAVGQAHGGSLTIDFSPGDDAGFEGYVLASDVPDGEGSPTSMDVQLPNLDCDACTLRVVQVNPDRSNYYSCADISLSGASASSSGDGSSGGDTSGGSSSGGESTGGPAETSSSGGGDESTDASATMSGTATTSATSATATAGDTGSGGTDSSAGTDDDDSGGCSCNSSAAPAPWLLVGLAGLVARRRRR